MASAQIKLDSVAFGGAWATQRSTLSALDTSYTKGQSIFNSLSSTWKGSGGDAFRSCATELTTESLTGTFMATILSNQITKVHTTMQTTDNNLANHLTLRKK